MSNSLDPDQARHFVGPDLDPNCLERLSANDTSRERVNLEADSYHLSYTNNTPTAYNHFLITLLVMIEQSFDA